MRFSLLILALLTALTAYGQGFKVKSMKMNDAEDAASIIFRKDNFGDPCGLVKVSTKVTGVEFVGRIIGKPSRPLDEYWVYLTAGTEELTIIRPNYLPITVRFADYGIQRIESSTTQKLGVQNEMLKEESVFN